MRIGHQIYNYLFDYTDSGTISLSDGIVLPDSDYCIMGAYINFDENQVYVILEDHMHNVVNKTINQFVNQMGGLFVRVISHCMNSEIRLGSMLNNRGRSTRNYENS